MIALIGGKFNGRYYKRDKSEVTPGSAIAIIDEGAHETYRMNVDGCAYYDDGDYDGPVFTADRPLWVY